MYSGQVLLTLPPGMAAPSKSAPGQADSGSLGKDGGGTPFTKLEHERATPIFATSDPKSATGLGVGSGGGTANLLAEAWRASGSGRGFTTWLAAEHRVVIHSGGQSRRLPAYAAVGKLLMPVSVERGSTGQRPDQSLLDLILASAEPVLQRAAPSARLTILSGDSLLRPFSLPPVLPEADIVCLAFEAPAEEASAFGTFFSRWESPDRLDFFLQKPSVERIEQLSETHRCLLDAGVWLLSERAVLALMARCGWEAKGERFQGGAVAKFDLYHEMGLSLGDHPSQPVTPGEAGALFAGLTAKVVAVQADFYHFGTSAQMIEAMTRLHNRSLAPAGGAGATFGRRVPMPQHRTQHVQNTVLTGSPDARLRDLIADPHQPLWVENCTLSVGSKLLGRNVLTGIPPLSFDLAMPNGICLDVVPIRAEERCWRFYGFEDAFAGAVGDAQTMWLGRPLISWLSARGISLEAAGLRAEQDIQTAPLFPELTPDEVSPEFFLWMLAPEPELNEAFTALWLRRRLSAYELPSEANLHRLYAQRAELRLAGLASMLHNSNRSVFFNMDLEVTAELMAPSATEVLLESLVQAEGQPLDRIHEVMFDAALLRHRGSPEAPDQEARAFQILRDAIVSQTGLQTQPPQSTLLPDQIVWGRSPLRLDLAGGWTDTPPYCLFHGGRVANVAVELNGQPPVQIFARMTAEPEIVLKSIDRGTQTTIREMHELTDGLLVGSDFSLAKAALALAGFSAEFAREGAPSLRDRLRAFGGGLEINMLSAVPKGSGLGTSSALSAALISTLGDVCGHNWSKQDVFDRVLVSEQLLTTGGGWQDQAGSVLDGVKELSTTPGLQQTIHCRWLPDRLLGAGYANSTILLYYTGITRTAKDVLGEIVRGMFLNSGRHLRVLEDIGANVTPVVSALQREDYQALGAAVRQSWELNQHLDSGTNPPKVQHIFGLIEDYILGAKLLGAGGGGYLVILCKDPEAAARTRAILSASHQEPGARFVDFTVSASGLVVTRS